MSEEKGTVMHIFINNDLGMNKGKIASQVGHAVQHLIENLVSFPNEEYLEWKKTGSKKIVLKVNQSEIKEIIKKFADKYGNTAIIHDAGHTQVASGSLTCVGFAPKYIHNVPIQWQKYKLL